MTVIQFPIRNNSTSSYLQDDDECKDKLSVFQKLLSEISVCKDRWKNDRLRKKITLSDIHLDESVIDLEPTLVSKVIRKIVSSSYKEASSNKLFQNKTHSQGAFYYNNDLFFWKIVLRERQDGSHIKGLALSLV